ncbi:MAG: transglycosylase domain-containing protein, partial [Slackia sp.]|nr:transglycosylase domain-containing protein [Slackia sp.]
MKPRRKQREARAHAGLWTVLVVTVGIGAALFGCYQGGMALVDEWCKDLPDVRDTDAYNLAEKSTIYANDYDETSGTGTVLAELYLEKREPVELDQVSRYVLEGTVATEDVRFYQHNGVDLQGIVRALFVNLTGGQEGASTITQQYVRNTLIADEMTDISLKRKVREMELAIELEKIYTKDEILMMYLNTINYGDGCYGIQAAAEHYYSVNAADLTIAQAATLIGIPNSPTMYNPVVNPEASIERRNLVLSRMLSNGVITQDEYNAAKAEELALHVKAEDGQNGIYEYPWFTTWVRDLLLAENNPYDFTTDKLFKGGYTIVTSIDPKMQQYAEEAVAKQYENGRLADSRQEFALTLIDPATGFVKAMIGGKDYWNGDQFNIATSVNGRPVGSTFKTFTLTDAIEKGISPSTMMNCDGPVKVSSGGGSSHSIYNYGQTDYGTMSIADMTAVSSNTGYVRLSFTDSEKSGVTPASINDVAARLGLNKANLKQNVPTTTLGVENANTTEMAAAYAAFANGGAYHEPTPIVEIIDRDGETIVDKSAGSQAKQVLDPSTAYAVTQVLEGVVEKPFGTATDARLASGQAAAGKTGTTDDWHDLWFVGYTPQLSCAVWTGDRSNQAELYTSPWNQLIWKDLMTRCLEGTPVKEFAKAPAPVYNSSYQGSYGSKESDEDDEK